MSRTAHLRLPFFDAKHRAFADELDQWAVAAAADLDGSEGAMATSTQLACAGFGRSARRGGCGIASPPVLAAPTTRCSRFIW